MGRRHVLMFSTFLDPKKINSGRSKKFLFAGTRPELQAQAPCGPSKKGGRAGSSPPHLGHGLALSSPSRELQRITVSRVSFVPPQQSRQRSVFVPCILLSFGSPQIFCFYIERLVFGPALVQVILLAHRTSATSLYRGRVG